MCYSEWLAYQLWEWGKEGHIAIVRHWTTPVSLRLIGIQMERLISHRRARELWDDGGVCACFRSGGVQMRQYFHNRKWVWKKELAEHRALISLWRNRVPGPNFGSHQGAIFSAYHSSFIMVWLPCRCYLACGRQTRHSWKPPQELLTCGTGLGDCVCLCVNALYRNGCSLPLFAQFVQCVCLCALLKCSPGHYKAVSLHLHMAVIFPLQFKKTAHGVTGLIITSLQDHKPCICNQKLSWLQALLVK